MGEVLNPKPSFRFTSLLSLHSLCLSPPPSFTSLPPPVVGYGSASACSGLGFRRRLPSPSSILFCLPRSSIFCLHPPPPFFRLRFSFLRLLNPRRSGVGFDAASRGSRTVFAAAHRRCCYRRRSRRLPPPIVQSFTAVFWNLGFPLPEFSLNLIRSVLCFLLFNFDFLYDENVVFGVNLELQGFLFPSWGLF